MRRGRWRLAALGLALLGAAGCASWPARWGDRPCCLDHRVTVRTQPIAWHVVDMTVVSPLAQAVQVGRLGRRLAGVPVRALNLADAETNPNIEGTAFFTDRPIAAADPEAVRWGPTQPDRALPVPPYTVTAVKAEGKTPGFFVEDAEGVNYLFKLDPVDAPELLSGAEVVTSKLLHLLGYHVPSYEIAWVELAELRSAPPELRPLLEERAQEGRLRVSASRLLEGELLGPARFARFRDCAEVRALKLAFAWVNDTDAKDHNTLLVWDGARTLGYLIDFGTSLGADAGLAGPKAPCAGWTYDVDLGVWAGRLLTLGWYRPRCDTTPATDRPAVGRFTAQLDPEGWKPYVPNFAFQQMTEDDARWMARRLARITPAQIDAAVAAGQYANPEDSAYLAQTLEGRRRIIVEHVLKKESGQ